MRKGLSFSWGEYSMSHDLKSTKHQFLAKKAKSRARSHERMEDSVKAKQSFGIAKRHEKQARRWNQKPTCEFSRKPEARQRTIERNSLRAIKNALVPNI